MMLPDPCFPGPFRAAQPLVAAAACPSLWCSTTLTGLAAWACSPSFGKSVRGGGSGLRVGAGQGRSQQGCLGLPGRHSSLAGLIPWGACPTTARPAPAAAGKYARVGTMLAKESVRKRMESDTGISYTEFTYQLLQVGGWVKMAGRDGPGGPSAAVGGPQGLRSRSQLPCCSASAIASSHTVNTPCRHRPHLTHHVSCLPGPPPPPPPPPPPQNTHTMQGYDFVHMRRQYGVRVQVGGSDQWGNILAGTDLMRRMLGGPEEGEEGADAAQQDGAASSSSSGSSSSSSGSSTSEAGGGGGTGEEPCFGLTFPLLLKADGSKFGKSESGALWLNGDMMSPYQFYQFLFKTADAGVGLAVAFVSWACCWGAGCCTGGRRACCGCAAARRASIQLLWPAAALSPSPRSVPPPPRIPRQTLPPCYALPPAAPQTCSSSCACSPSCRWRRLRRWAHPCRCVRAAAGRCRHPSCHPHHAPPS